MPHQRRQVVEHERHPDVVDRGVGEGLDRPVGGRCVRGTATGRRCGPAATASSSPSGPRSAPWRPTSAVRRARLGSGHGVAWWKWLGLAGSSAWPRPAPRSPGRSGSAAPTPPTRSAPASTSGSPRPRAVGLTDRHPAGTRRARLGGWRVLPHPSAAAADRRLRRPRDGRRAAAHRRPRLRRLLHAGQRRLDRDRHLVLGRQRAGLAGLPRGRGRSGGWCRASARSCRSWWSAGSRRCCSTSSRPPRPGRDRRCCSRRRCRCSASASRPTSAATPAPDRPRRPASRGTRRCRSGGATAPVQGGGAIGGWLLGGHHRTRDGRGDRAARPAGRRHQPAAAARRPPGRPIGRPGRGLTDTRDDRPRRPYPCSV